MSQSNDNHLCDGAFCQKIAIAVCDACKNAFYCTECVTTDGENHLASAYCIPLKEPEKVQAVGV